jgi:hypothetical protein
MSAAVAVITRLEAVAAVTAIVSSRIYQGVIPQDATFPAIRAQRISEDEPMHLRGASSMFRTRVQVDSVSNATDPIGQATALDALVHGDGSGSSLVGWKGEAGSVQVHAVLPIAVREQFDAEELRQYRVMRDLHVWWSQ